MALCLQTKRLIFVQLALTFLFYNSKLNNNKNNGTGIDENYKKINFYPEDKTEKRKLQSLLKADLVQARNIFLKSSFFTF